MSQNWRKSVFIVKSCPKTNHHISEDWEQRKDLYTSKKCVWGGAGGEGGSKFKMVCNNNGGTNSKFWVKIIVKLDFYTKSD